MARGHPLGGARHPEGTDRIGSNDHDHGLIGAAFNPFERYGGGITHAGQINLDSGAFNPEQISKDYGKKAGKLWAKSRLRDRWDALIAHSLLNLPRQLAMSPS